MQQAGLLEAKADAKLLEARGAFDPKLYGDYDDKAFDQKNYFNIGEAGLKVPLWWGADVKVGYLWSDGVFLNASDNLPTAGQAVIGVELPLVQGLAIDKRRTQVKQAKLYREANVAARQVMINDLLLEATVAYWDWAYARRTLLI